VHGLLTLVEQPAVEGQTAQHDEEQLDTRTVQSIEQSVVSPQATAAWNTESQARSATAVACFRRNEDTDVSECREEIDDETNEHLEK
jgi:hypothetical protein